MSAIESSPLKTLSQPSLMACSIVAEVVRARDIAEDFVERGHFIADLAASINTAFPNLQLIMFGSSRTLLFSAASDIDVCVVQDAGFSQISHQSQCHILRQIQSITQMLFSKIELVENANIPLIRASKPHGQFLIDIVASTDGIRKSFYIMSLCTLFKPLLAVLYVLLRWIEIQSASSVSNATAPKRLISTHELIMLFVGFAIEKHWIQLSSDGTI